MVCLGGYIKKCPLFFTDKPQVMDSFSIIGAKDFGGGEIGGKSARVWWGDSVSRGFAAVFEGVKSPHPFNAIKGKKIALERERSRPLCHPLPLPCRLPDRQRERGSNPPTFDKGEGEKHPRRPSPSPPFLPSFLPSFLSPSPRPLPLTPCHPRKRRDRRAVIL